MNFYCNSVRLLVMLLLGWGSGVSAQSTITGFSATSKHLYSSGHPAPGSGLVNPFGLIRSKDGGKTWQKLGLEGETDFHLLATSWNTNAMYVWNHAPSSRMKAPGRLASAGEGLSALFDLEGKHLWYGAFDGRPRLARLPLSGGNPVQIALPPLKDDAVAYIAQNPTRRLEYAIATFQRSVYLSKDAGQSWKQIADRGAAK